VAPLQRTLSTDMPPCRRLSTAAPSRIAFIVSICQRQRGRSSGSPHVEIRVLDRVDLYRRQTCSIIETNLSLERHSSPGNLVQLCLVKLLLSQRGESDCANEV